MGSTSNVLEPRYTRNIEFNCMIRPVLTKSSNHYNFIKIYHIYFISTPTDGELSISISISKSIVRV
jgi:hypothetical protein